MPSAASNSTDHEQIAAFLCLGRMAVLVTLTHNKEAVAAVAPIIISHITQVCSSLLSCCNDFDGFLLGLFRLQYPTAKQQDQMAQ
jgi:hypothetical protein